MHTSSVLVTSRSDNRAPLVSAHRCDISSLAAFADITYQRPTLQFTTQPLDQRCAGYGLQCLRIQIRSSISHSKITCLHKSCPLVRAGADHPRTPRPEGSGWGTHVSDRAPYGSECEKGHSEATGPHESKEVHEGEGAHRGKL